MAKKREGISEDYKVEIEQALEEVIQRPVCPDSLEAKVLPVGVPDTVEQLLDYAHHAARTEYVPEVKVYEDAQESPASYWYHTDADSDAKMDSSTQTVSYQFQAQETETLQNASDTISSAVLYNTFGVHNAFTNLNESDQAKIDTFKLLHKAEWLFMYEASSWLVSGI